MGRKKQEAGNKESAAAGNEILNLAESYYGHPSSDRIAEILALEGKPEEALADMSSFLAHYEGGFQPAEVERIIITVEAIDEDGKSILQSDSYILRDYLSEIANMFIYKHGDILTPSQIERILEGMSVNKLGGWALESLITLHNRDIPLEQADFMLKRWGINSLRLAVVERYGRQLSTERVKALIDELSQAKEMVASRLDREIQSKGPYTDISNLPMIRERDGLPEGLRNNLLDERCPDIYSVLSSIAKNCADQLAPEDIDQLDNLGNPLVQAHLIAYCWQGMTPERQQALRSPTKPLAVWCALINYDLPIPIWKDKLIEEVVETMDADDLHLVEMLVSEPYMSYLSPNGMEKLLSSKAFGKFLFKKMNYLPENMPVAIDTILQIHGRKMTPEWFDEFGERLPAECMPLILEHGREGIISHIIENYSERLPGAPDIEARIDLFLKNCGGYASSEWLQEHVQHISPIQVSKLIDSISQTYGRYHMIETISRLCPEKVLPEKIKVFWADCRGDAGRKLRPLLVEKYWPHLLEHFEELVLSSNFEDEFLQQHAEKLSPTQIEEWRKKADIFSMRNLLTYCGTRLESEQIQQCADFLQDNHYKESLYMSVAVSERRPGLQKLLIKEAGQHMSEESITEFIETDSNGEWSALFLRHHPNRLSPAHKQEIARRFGYRYHKVALGSFED